MLVQQFLERSAERYPDKTALICGDQRLTYAQIEEHANRLAHALIDGGVQRGDRVGVYLPNSVEAVVAVFAALKAGAAFVVVNATTKRDKLAYVLGNCRATALVTAARHADLVAALSAEVPSLQLAVLCGAVASSRRSGTGESELPCRPGASSMGSPGSQRSPSGHGVASQAGAWRSQGGDGSPGSGPACLTYDDIMSTYPPDRPTCRNIDQDLACLIYTSGSTGDPKGVVSGHNNVAFVSGSIIEYLENTPEDIVIGLLPLSFDYGLYQLLMVFRFGGTLVLENGFTYPAAVLKTMEAERVTGFPGVPTLFAILLRMDLSVFDLSALRYITNTAAALPPSHIAEIRRAFPWATLYSMYGLTECKRTLYLPPDQLDARPGSVGIAIPGTEVWIEDTEGQRVGPGVVGELVIRGSHVMRGYWEAPEPTAARYRPGPTPGERVLYSGDLFRADKEGYLYFVARKDDIIKSRGEKVSPKEVENVLYALNGVVEAAVVGTPDPILGEAIVAYLVLDGADLTERDVLRHCRAHLEDFMVPQRVEFRAELPKTSSGKIRKTGLT
jgi:long-chain acyl-CoA synthetase